MDARRRWGTRAAVLWLAASLPAAAVAQSTHARQTKPLDPAAAPAAAPPEIPFEVVPDFFKLPDDLFFGEAAGVAVDSKGHIFVFSRGNTTGPAYGAAAAQLLEFAPDGVTAQ